MKVNWKEEEENLRKMIGEGVSYVEIGKKYGVTYNAIKKAAKKMGIVLAPRREINPLETFGKGSNDVVSFCRQCGKEFSHPKYLGKVDFCSEECKKEFNKSSNLVFSPSLDKEYYTRKHIGELGEQIAIGELGKYGIQVMVPFSDNLPFDLVVYLNNKFYKCQVKSSTFYKNGGIVFKTYTGMNAKTTHYYTNDEVDVFILCDLEHIFLMRYDEVTDKVKGNITLRYSAPSNNQYRHINYASDYVISQKRIEEVFN